MSCSVSASASSPVSPGRHRRSAPASRPESRGSHMLHPWDISQHIVRPPCIASILRAHTHIPTPWCYLWPHGSVCRGRSDKVVPTGSSHSGNASSHRSAGSGPRPGVGQFASWRGKSSLPGVSFQVFPLKVSKFPLCGRTSVTLG